MIDSINELGFNINNPFEIFLRYNDTDFVSTIENDSNIRTKIDTQLGIFRSLRQKLDEDISVKDFGAESNNLDNTFQIQNAIDYASQRQTNLYLPAGTYDVSSLRLKKGLKSFYGPGKLRGHYLSYSGQAVMELDGTFFSNPPLIDCFIGISEIDCDEKQNFAVFGGGNNTNISIIGVKIYGVPLGRSAIQFNSGSSGIKIINNQIILPVAPVASSGTYGIAMVGSLVDYESGYFSNQGIVAAPLNPCFEVSIHNNKILNGSHGIVLTGVLRSIVSDNICSSQASRSIVLSPASTHNIVANNVCAFFVSSGIHLAYGSNFNLISNNYVYSPGATGEAGIQAYLACSVNKISNNYIKCGSRYGIYVAIGSSKNEISLNTISDYSIAAIAVESDWNPFPPSGAKYTRPTYTSPPSGYRWAYFNSESNSIRSNIVKSGKYDSEYCGIYLSALSGPQGTSSIYSQLFTFVESNLFQQNTNYFEFYIFEQTSASLQYITLKNNSFYGNNPSYFFLQNGRSHFKLINGNSFINDGKIIIPDGSTTPMVAIGEKYEFNNSSLTVVINFIGGVDNQTIILRLNVNTTIVYNPNFIRLKNNTDITNKNSDCFLSLINSNDVWIELYRNF